MFSHVVAAVLLTLPFLAQSVVADCSRNYTVQAGDICDGISAANNVSTYQLAVVNTGTISAACDNLNPGDSICLGYPGQDCADTYVVQPNDSCDSVTSMAGVNSTMLYLNNPQLAADCSNLYVGEVLCTAQTVQVPPAPSGAVIPGATIPSTAAPALPTDEDEDLPWCDEL